MFPLFIIGKILKILKYFGIFFGWKLFGTYCHFWRLYSWRVYGRKLFWLETFWHIMSLLETLWPETFWFETFWADTVINNSPLFSDKLFMFVRSPMREGATLYSSEEHSIGILINLQTLVFIRIRYTQCIIIINSNVIRP